MLKKLNKCKIKLLNNYIIMLKINKDTQGSSNISIPAPVAITAATEYFKKGYEFPLVRLVNVSFDPAKVVKLDGEESTTPALLFTFVDDKKRMLSHYEYPIDMTVDKAEQRQSALIQRIKHIWDETVGADKDIDIEGETFAEFFESTAKAFNSQTFEKTEGDKTKTYKFYAATLVYLKATYYKTRLGLPQYPNFVQKAFNGSTRLACELIISPDYDKVTPQSKANTNTNPGITPHSGGFASEFGGDFGMGIPNV
jgi:hypothetical protein